VVAIGEGVSATPCAAPGLGRPTRPAAGGATSAPATGCATSSRSHQPGCVSAGEHPDAVTAGWHAPCVGWQPRSTAAAHAPWRPAGRGVVDRPRCPPAGW